VWSVDLPDMQQADSGLQAMARRAYAIGVWLLLASIIVQFFLAGLGVFASSAFFYWHATVNAAIVGVGCKYDVEFESQP